MFWFRGFFDQITITMQLFQKHGVFKYIYLHELKFSGQESQIPPYIQLWGPKTFVL